MVVSSSRVLSFVRGSAQKRTADTRVSRVPFLDCVFFFFFDRDKPNNRRPGENYFKTMDRVNPGRFRFRITFRIKYSINDEHVDTYRARIGRRATQGRRWIYLNC